MNKTVNINLAGVFFHVDEDAYGKLQRYLAAIKRSFEGMQGEDEIIGDIEARISELFSERIKDERQVISTKELDEVIAIMGQPEDYRVDDDLFDDEGTDTSSKKPKQAARIAQRRFYRDTNNAYIGGVSSGMAHYLGIDPLWVRIGWVLLILLTWFTLGGTALIYLALWVFVPEAQTTADKLAMRGKAVNIDNITEKVKEGFENVADTVKNVDYDKYGNNLKTGAQGIFGSLGKVIMFFLKIFAKIVGVFLVIVGASVVISLLITFLTGGVVDIFTPNLADMPWITNDTGLPIWLVLLLIFFAVGIPFFFLFYLGLKILSSNLKSMPLSAKLSLLGLWLIATITLGVFAVRQGVQYANMDTAKISMTKTLPITKIDTVRITMIPSREYDVPLGSSSQYVKVINGDDSEGIAIYRNIRLIVQSTTDSIGSIRVDKRTRGLSYDTAKERVELIDYNYALRNGELKLDGFFTGEREDKFSRHKRPEVQILLYLPEGTTLIADDNTYSYHRNSGRYRDILDNGYEEKYLTVKDGELTCPTCPEKQDRNQGYYYNDDDWDSSDNEWQERSYEDGEPESDWKKMSKTPEPGEAPQPPQTPNPDTVPTPPVVVDPDGDNI